MRYTPQKPFLIHVPQEKTCVGMSDNFLLDYIFIRGTLFCRRAHCTSVNGEDASSQGMRASSCGSEFRRVGISPKAVPWMDRHLF